MRRQKSNTSLNAPSFSRAAMMLSTAPSPTPLTADKPKRMTFFLFSRTTEKSMQRQVDVGLEHLDAVRAHLGHVLDDLVGVFLVARQKRPP